MTIGKNELSWAARYTDAQSEEHDDTRMVLAEVDVDPDGAEELAGQRAIRLYAILTDQSFGPGAAVGIADPRLFAALQTAWLDGAACALLARRGQQS